MKKIFTMLVVAAVFTACKNEDKKLVEAPKSEVIENKTTTWIDSFKAFRTAVYQDDKAKIETFIDFPITGEVNEINEIWNLIRVENADLSKPLSEKVFDEKYHKIFTKPFINSILKIKTEILYKTGSFETDFIKEGKTSYKVYSTFDKKNNKLELAFHSETIVNEKSEGEVDDSTAEFAVIYYFDIIKDNQLKFRYIRMAG